MRLMIGDARSLTRRGAGEIDPTRSLYVGRSNWVEREHGGRGLRWLWQLGNPYNVSEFGGESGPAARAFLALMDDALNNPSAMERKGYRGAGAAEMTRAFGEVERMVRSGEIDTLLCHGCPNCHAHALGVLLAERLPELTFGGRDAEIVASMKDWLGERRRERSIPARVLRDGDGAQEFAGMSTTINEGVAAPLAPGLRPNPELDGIDHINVYSNGKTPLGKALSNLANIPCECGADGAFQSVEGYWYWLGVPEGTPGRDRLRDLHGVEAKNVGRELGGQDWNTDPAFKRKIVAAIEAKLDAPLKDKAREVLGGSSTLREALKNSELPLRHYYLMGPDKKMVEEKRAEWVIEAIEGIRDRELGRGSARLDAIVTEPPVIRGFATTVGSRYEANNGEGLLATLGKERADAELEFVKNVGTSLAKLGIASVHGHADGTDHAFGEGASVVARGFSIGVLPWRGFQGLDPDDVSSFLLSKELAKRAEAVAVHVHPAHEKLLQKDMHGKLGLHARNVAQVYNLTLDQPTLFLLALAPLDRDGVKGGTATAHSLAAKSLIPTFRLLHPGEREQFLDLLVGWESGKIALPKTPPRLTPEVMLGIADRSVHVYAQSQWQQSDVMRDVLRSHLSSFDYVIDATRHGMELADELKAGGTKVVGYRQTLGETGLSLKRPEVYEKAISEISRAARASNCVVVTDEPVLSRSRMFAEFGFALAGKGINTLYHAPDKEGERVRGFAEMVADTQKQLVERGGIPIIGLGEIAHEAMEQAQTLLRDRDDERRALERQGGELEREQVISR